MKRFITLSFIFLFFSLNKAFSQKVSKGLPNDLDEETIIFLDYDELLVKDSLSILTKYMYNTRNNLAKYATKQLRNKVVNYPFKYVISKRSEYKDSLVNYCRYILECDLMIRYNSGVNMYLGSSKSMQVRYVYVSDMYILDLKTGDKFILFKISSDQVYRYNYIMKKFIRKVKHKYKNKK